MTHPTPFGIALAQSNNQIGMALVTLLAWVATCDGHFDARERKMIQEIAAEQLTREQMDLALHAATAANPRDIQLVCEVLRSMDMKRRQLFVELAVGVAVIDGKLAVSENHVVRFLADVMGVGALGLNQIYQGQTDRDAPKPSDLGSANWWSARESDHSGDDQRRSRARPGGSAIMEAYAILGLSRGASQDEVRLAYRRLAKIHHPDKYESLGPEAVRAANETFKRIQTAYRAVKDA